MFGPRTILWKSLVILLSWLEDDFKDNSNWSCMPWSTFPSQMVIWPFAYYIYIYIDVLYQDLAPSMEVWLGDADIPSPTNNRFWWRLIPIFHDTKKVWSAIYPKKATVKGEKSEPTSCRPVACSTVSCSLTRSHFVMWGWIAWWFPSGIALEKDGSYEIHWNPGRLSSTSQDPETYWWDQNDKPDNECPVLKDNHATLVYYYALLEAIQI